MSNNHVTVNNKGIALIMVLLIVMSLALLASGVFLVTTTEIYVSRNDANSKEAFFIAEAGLHHAERALFTITSVDQIQAMYARGYTGCPSFRNKFIGHQFMSGDATPVWIRNDNLDVSGPVTRGYQVFIENDETDDYGVPLLVENNSVFVIRSVGTVQAYGGMLSRQILEQAYSVTPRQGIGYNSQFGGGPTGLTPQ